EQEQIVLGVLELGADPDRGGQIVRLARRAVARLATELERLEVALLGEGHERALVELVRREIAGGATAARRVARRGGLARWARIAHVVARRADGGGGGETRGRDRFAPPRRI